MTLRQDLTADIDFLDKEATMLLDLMQAVRRYEGYSGHVDLEEFAEEVEILIDDRFSVELLKLRNYLEEEPTDVE